MKSRELFWQATTDSELMVVPVEIVTEVGAVALANGMVNVCDNTCERVQQVFPPQGTYEMIPSTLIVATY